ncbi:cadherin-related family member 4 [Bombina bombina]|uniref:cadherin-related family member 4 n=1 Tax=Bombina bombina TaxID=8345 RepID=UPI00235B2287|nr:cadherin-related family member 4 [Bombina bombina]
MGSVPLAVSFIFLLIIQGVPGQEFVGLPETVNLAESSAIGTLVYSFTFMNCTNSSMKVEIQSVNPASNFFNSPSLSRITGTSDNTVQITLSSSASLNANVVNQYSLDLLGTCGTEIAAGQLFIKVIDDVKESQCETKFASQVGDTIQVYYNVPSSSPIYKVVLRQPKNASVTYSIIQPIPSPFSVSTTGSVLAPAAGFTNAAATYQIQILVKDAAGTSCNGTLNIEVLPIITNPVNFTVSSIAVTITENGGPDYLVKQVKAQGKDVLYEMITPSSAYYIESDTGTIRTIFNLDLEGPTPVLAFTNLQVRAYDKFNRMNSAIVSVDITVLDVNDLAPSCTPSVFVTQVPENTPLSKALLSLSCQDPDVNKTSLTFSVIPNANSLYSFRMDGSNLVVNKTLTYDSAEIASVNFQYSATIVVTDKGSPSLTTNIPVFVTVTPVNNYPPICNGPLVFSVNENAPFATSVGKLNATDADYKFNNVEYSIEGNPTPPVFYINPRSGEINLLSTLDFETVNRYTLSVKVVDLNNDIMPDPVNQKTIFCTVTINVQDINDNPPVCTPPFYRTEIYSTLVTTQSILSLTCTDRDIVSVPLYYTIVGGNTNNRFTMINDNLLHNTFSYNPDGVYDPVSYELLVQVTDNLNPPIYSTTATVFITVVPWTTTKPTTTVTTTAPPKQTKIIHKTLTYWEPDTWFIVVLTLTGALLLIALALLTWKLCKGSTICFRGTKEAVQPLLQESSLTNVQHGPAEAAKRKPPTPIKEKKDVAPVSPLSLQFDGRAQDPVTGREYLFNSQTGERRWI